jgi:hypothetical protein
VQVAETTSADVNKIEVEIDNSPMEWVWRGLPHGINRALRILYRYRHMNAPVWVTDHLLIGYEGSDASERPRDVAPASVDHSRPDDLQLIRSLSNTIAENAGQSARSDYEAAGTLRNLTYERLSTVDVSGKHAAALSSAIALEIALLIFIVLNFSRGIRAFSVIANLVIGTASAQTTAIEIPQSSIVGLLWFGAVGLFLVVFALIWASFFTERKNPSAEFLVTHIVTTVVGGIAGYISHGAIH